jgi:hypothetical protein
MDPLVDDYLFSPARYNTVASTSGFRFSFTHDITANLSMHFTQPLDKSRLKASVQSLLVRALLRYIRPSTEYQEGGLIGSAGPLSKCSLFTTYVEYIFYFRADEVLSKYIFES